MTGLGGVAEPRPASELLWGLANAGLAARCLHVPSATGVLFDLPDVIGSVELGHPGMFVDALPQADAYLLMDVVHDWPDEECVAILSAVRRAAPAEATVLVVEAIVPDGPVGARTATLDVIMLMLSGGRERTADELRVLLARPGFGLKRVLETPGPVRIAEARPGG